MQRWDELKQRNCLFQEQVLLSLWQTRYLGLKLEIQELKSLIRFQKWGARRRRLLENYASLTGILRNVVTGCKVFRIRLLHHNMEFQIYLCKSMNQFLSNLLVKIYHKMYSYSSNHIGHNRFPPGWQITIYNIVEGNPKKAFIKEPAATLPQFLHSSRSILAPSFAYSPQYH